MAEYQLEVMQLESRKTIESLEEKIKTLTKEHEMEVQLIKYESEKLLSEVKFAKEKVRRCPKPSRRSAP